MTTDAKELHILEKIVEKLELLPDDCKTQNWTNYYSEVISRIAELREILQ